MSQGRPVKDLWWEGDTFCTEFEDGTIMKFEKAYIASMNMNFEDSDCIKTETFVAEPLNLFEFKLSSDIIIKSGENLGVLEAFKVTDEPNED